MTTIIKIVEITAQRPLSAQNTGGQKFIAGRGEAGIYAAKARAKAVDLTRSVEPGVLIESLLAPESGGFVALETGSRDGKVVPAEYIVFLPVQPMIGEAYNTDLHLSGLDSVLAQAEKKGLKDFTLRMTPPGTFEGREVAESRKQEVEQYLLTRGVSVEWLWATADLPEGERSNYAQVMPVAYAGFAPNRGDMFVSGSRELRSARVTDAMRQVGQMLMQAQKPARLILPLTIGANLALAEAAQASGVPVVLAFIGSRPETWMEDNQARVNALTAAGARIIGDTSREFEQGLFSASIEFLADQVLQAQGKVALMAPIGDERSEGHRLSRKPGVANLFPQVKAYIAEVAGQGALDADLNRQEGRAQVQAAQQVAQARKAEITTDDIPF